ncbi:putative bifunctional diguanylate cyclase/phosphodiesterase [Granulicella sibirica]|uniref:Diguanylate cyclase/phosphodiesterase (GGDEF & EAL domains) with PAS/PAC sensor(S) n=1 Tax=Granulicella sibirica TaxID=2479048 RepID=A0A4Q0T6Q9_9BACT|nr:EAL domain-containing protein [Granulicella sibirica]RXH58350.1 diguanylate cyclase/phosphodiesterase (GGDEF & EAL domains) with PAS/PAC sensor(s) [Granulicella sibirica]
MHISLEQRGLRSAAIASASLLPAWTGRLITLARRRLAGSSNETRLSAAMDISPTAVFLHDAVRDDSGRLTGFRFNYLNSAAERLIGHPRAYLKGKLVTEVHPASDLPLYQRVLDSNEPTLVERECSLPGRPKTVLRMHLSPLPNGLLLTCEDITAERRLARSLAFNKSLVTSTTSSILVLELDGSISSLNPAAEYMLGYTQPDLVGKSITLLHDPIELLERSRQLSSYFEREISPDSNVLFARPQAGLHEAGEWTWICRNGVRIPVQLTINPVHDEDGVIIAFMGTSFDLTDRKQTDQYIYHIAHHDPLTGLAGRTLLREQIQLAAERSERTHALFSVLMVDLDHFKRVNDSLGHETGDMVLREVAFRLRDSVRKSDTVARFSGDQFVILLDGVSGRIEAEAIAHKVTEAFARPIHVGGQQVILTASIGLSMYPESASPEELLKHADIALHHGKTTGRNGLAVFTPELGRLLHDRLRLESALRTALERHELFLVYQPQISLSTHRLVGVEALLRWRSPEFGLVMPNTFIPLAEETGLIVAIGAWCLECACQEIAALQRQVGNTISVAVNLSPSQLHEEHFLETVERALTVSGLIPSSLEVEITERLLMSDSEESLQIVERVQSLGVTTAIDDFGTGFSNMSYITRFKVDRLKIDRSFVSRCLSDANSLAVTTAIIALAHSLNMEVIAEGVESVEQAVMLRALECDSAQGYLFAHPLTLPEITSYSRSMHDFDENTEAPGLWMYRTPASPGPVTFDA